MVVWESIGEDHTTSDAHTFRLDGLSPAKVMDARVPDFEDFESELEWCEKEFRLYWQACFCGRTLTVLSRNRVVKTTKSGRTIRR